MTTYMLTPVLSSLADEIFKANLYVVKLNWIQRCKIPSSMFGMCYTFNYYVTAIITSLIVFQVQQEPF